MVGEQARRRAESEKELKQRYFKYNEEKSAVRRNTLSQIRENLDEDKTQLASETFDNIVEHAKQTQPVGIFDQKFTRSVHDERREILHKSEFYRPSGQPLVKFEHILADFLQNPDQEEQDETQAALDEEEAAESEDFEDKTCMHLERYYVAHEKAIFLIPLMQGFIALLTELINLVMITGQRNILDVVMNYIAIKIISDVDNIYMASGILDVTLAKILNSEAEWKPKVVAGYVPFADRPPLNKAAFVVWKVHKLLFNSLYFYFFPFVALILNMFARNCSTIPTTGINADTWELETETLCQPINLYYLSDAFRNAWTLLQAG